MNRPQDLLSDLEQALLIFLQGVDWPLAADLLDLRGDVEHRLAPTAIYPALARLDSAGFAKRVTSFSAWIARPVDPTQASGLLVTRDRCAPVEESAEVSAETVVTDVAVRRRSNPLRLVFEVDGHCVRCNDVGPRKETRLK